mmetsp:Transcript_542/g.3839  ORF Transcript_542/g.3839 Transcript_542/m.3839 type:complete len:297 (-) Transcript_542:3177-4067(-)
MRTSDARLRRFGGCRKTWCRARREEEGGGKQGAPKRLETKVLGRWTEKGYFAMEDPKAPLQSLKKRKRPIPDVLDSNEPIWNTNWQEKMDAVARDEARKKREEEVKSQPASGFLSLSRLNELADTHLDLSEQLNGQRESCAKDRPEGPEESQVDEPFETSSSKTERNYDDVYEEETNNLIVWTLVSTVVCSSLVLLFYSESKAASYAIGAMFGLTYFAMLSTSVAAVGSNDLFKRTRGLIGQPRILVPMLMVFSWKKWGLVMEEQVGIHLELTFMIAGFFTYQIGAFAQVLQSQQR